MKSLKQIKSKHSLNLFLYLFNDDDDDSKYEQNETKIGFLMKFFNLIYMNF
jgi:hypothetical protein